MTEEQEDAAYDSQLKFIRDNFGDEAANKCNLGWAVDEVDEVIETKVYGHGVLVTHVPTLTHTFHPR